MDDRMRIASAVANAAGLDAQEIAGMLETPPDRAMGDYALPCFKLARTLKKAPPVIAREIAEGLSLPETVSRAQVEGGYLNFFIDRERFVARVIGDNAARIAPGAPNGKTVVIDYSSVNIAKPLHIGHLLTTVIGNSLKEIYTHMGYRVVGINHLGDWGTQFGKLICAYKLWGSEETLSSGGVAELTRLYVRYHAEAEKDESLNDAARAWFKRIEDADPEALELFNKFREITLAEVARVYELLGVSFDYYQGESFYNDKMEPVVAELREKGLLCESEGAYVVDLSGYYMPPCIILRRDGATLYATRDLAAAFYRKKTFDFDKCLYVVAYQQDLHFRQWFKVVELMGYEWARDLKHVSFGMVSLEDGAMSTRKGHVVLLEDVLNRAIEKTREIMEEKSPDLADKEGVARQVGVGAVVMSALYTGRIKDMVFSWDRALNFDGETAPYVQYTHARCCSVLERAGEITAEPDFSATADGEAYEVADLLSRFPQAVADAAEKYEPYIVTRHVIATAQAFNRYYYCHRIIDDDPRATAARLRLTAAVRDTIRTGLSLLGIAAPQKM